MPPPWNRLVRFIAREDNQEHIGEPVDPDLDVGAAIASHEEVQITAFSGTSVLDPDTSLSGQTFTIKTILPPLSPREVGTIRCIGLNYRNHAKEMSLPIPTYPSVFFKPSTCLNSPNADLVISYQATDAQADYEAELAVIIGKTCRNVTPDEAMDYVLGYACANDVTARKWQFAGGNTQWGYGKGFDGFCPLGPVLVSSGKIPDPSVISLKTELNGEVMQEGRADDMIFSVAEIVGHLSQGTTLEAGTMILTGTPHGIGVSKTPAVFLRHGDDVRIVMSHGLGSLVNKVVYEKQRAE